MGNNAILTLTETEKAQLTAYAAKYAKTKIKDGAAWDMEPDDWKPYSRNVLRLIAVYWECWGAPKTAECYRDLADKYDSTYDCWRN